MQNDRGQFSSRLGFVVAAAGSAVGLGNIWGFPTNVASNGGAAFVLVYLVLAFCLAYPALMAELTIGRHTRSNIVTALQAIADTPRVRRFGWLAGYCGVVTASLILSFYALIAGWVMAHCFAHLLQWLGFTVLAAWLSEDSLSRNLAAALTFLVLTVAVVSAGVHRGIEIWSERLMPALLLLLVSLIAYVLLQDNAAEGLSVYLVPDFSRVTDPELILSALGQSFFSLSLGVGTMLIYSSYLSHEENLPLLGAQVTLVDTGIAFLAGLLMIPAMFIAQKQGVAIYNGDQLAAGPDLIFRILPGLFESMGNGGQLIATAFFALLAIAALTSSISMLEVPVSLIVENSPLRRKSASWLTGLVIYCVTALITVFFDQLFGLAVTLTTVYSEPLMGIVLCVFAGWVWNRNSLLRELQQGSPEIARGLFWKLWPGYVRFVCPVLIFAAFAQSLLS